MKNLLFIFLLLISCDSNKKNMNKEVDFFKIDFQNYFNKDSASFYINDCLIFRNKILESDKTDGITDLSFMIRIDEKNFLTTENYYLNGCKSHNLNVSLKVVLNGIVSLFEIDLNNGRYIGFEKGINDKVKLNQSEEPFEYD